MGGWKLGLGQGLQNAAQAIPLYHQLKQAAAQQALQQQEAELRQKQFGLLERQQTRLEEGDTFKDYQTFLNAVPEEGRVVGPEVYANAPDLWKGNFRPEQERHVDPTALPATALPGTPQLGEMRETGNFRAMPTEDVKQRYMLNRVMLQQAGMNNRADAANATRQAIANARLVLDQMKREDTQGYRSQLIAQAEERIALAEAALAMRENERNDRWNIAADRSERGWAAYENPTQSGSGMDMATLLGGLMGQPGAATPGAPVAPPQPRTRPMPPGAQPLQPRKRPVVRPGALPAPGGGGPTELAPPEPQINPQTGKPYAVGDPVSVKGVPYVVESINPDGKLNLRPR